MDGEKGSRYGTMPACPPRLLACTGTIEKTESLSVVLLNPMRRMRSKSAQGGACAGVFQ